MPKVRSNPYPKIKSELTSRFGNILKSIPFMAYFIFGVVFIGGIGVWLPYLLNNQEDKVFFESQNLFTFSVAILGMIFIEGYFSSTNKSLAGLGVIFGLVAFCLCTMGYWYTRSGFSLLILIGSIMSLMLFLLANVNDERFDDDVTDGSSNPTGYPSASIDKIKDSNS